MLCEKRIKRRYGKKCRPRFSLLIMERGGDLGHGETEFTTRSKKFKKASPSLKQEGDILAGKGEKRSRRIHEKKGLVLSVTCNGLAFGGCLQFGSFAQPK